MRMFDFSSWQSILSALFSLLIITLLGVGIRMLVMMTIQQRRERMNRQINERLRTLMAAYKTLGGSFTGNLMVDPRHKRDLHRAEPPVPATDPEQAVLDLEAVAAADAPANISASQEGDSSENEGSDRARRIRDAVESALSDIILLGTEEQVQLAARAATELAEGRPVHTHELVIALRDFIRDALDLDPIADDITIPVQGPTRPASSGGRGGGAGREGGNAGRGGGGGMGGAGGGMGMGMGLGMGGGLGLAHRNQGSNDDPIDPTTNG